MMIIITITIISIIIILIIIWNTTHKGKFERGFKRKMEKKVMHGRYIRNIDRQLISEEDTFLWLSKGDLKAET